MVVKLRDYPEEGEFVVATVRQVKSFGAFVVLDEYDNKEGFITLTEIASGWIKYPRDHIRERQKIVCKVMKVDVERGFIDLSLKRVNEHQRQEKLLEWKNEQKAEKLFELLARELNKSVDSCYDEFGLKLIDTYGSLYGAFETAVLEPKSFKRKWQKKGSVWLEKFMKLAEDNIPLPYVRISGIIELTCPDNRGAIFLREALTEMESLNKDDENIKIEVYYVSAPLYRVEVQAPDYKTAENILKHATTRAIKYIQKHGGKGEFHRK